MDKDQNIEKWSSMDTITDYLGVSRETVLQWTNNRNMPAHNVGRFGNGYVPAAWQTRSELDDAGQRKW